MEITNLHDKPFKVIIIKILIGLREEYMNTVRILTKRKDKRESARAEIE